MPKVELVAFETEVEKQCADWVLAVTRQLAKDHEAIKALVRGLQQKIANIPFPENTEDKDLNAIPARINEILSHESVRLKGVVDLTLYAKVDIKGKKVKVDGFGLAGVINDLCK